MGCGEPLLASDRGGADGQTAATATCGSSCAGSRFPATHSQEGRASSSCRTPSRSCSLSRRPRRLPRRPPLDRSVTAADETAIRAVLRGYEHGYGALSVPEITRVYPGINADALADNFKLMRALSVEIINPRISIVGSTATVVCQVRQRYTPHVGSRGQSTVNVDISTGQKGRCLGHRRSSIEQ